MKTVDISLGLKEQRLARGLNLIELKEMMTKYMGIALLLKQGQIGLSNVEKGSYEWHKKMERISELKERVSRRLYHAQNALEDYLTEAMINKSRMGAA